MTVRINTQYTKVIFSKRSPSWSLEASEFLLKLWRTPLEEVYSTADHDEFLSESLEYNMDIANSIQDHVNNLQTRMDLQLNVLYSFVAQRDNRLNTRIAKSSGRDSVSMKILAFISALFLPPSYIAVSQSRFHLARALLTKCLTDLVQYARPFQLGTYYRCCRQHSACRK
jgi:glutamate-1-semialdehyde 2,1-aminomutase